MIASDVAMLLALLLYLLCWWKPQLPNRRPLPLFAAPFAAACLT